MSDNANDRDNDPQGTAKTKLEKGFGRARPVALTKDDYYLKVNPDSGDLWIVHDKPVDLDLERAQFDQKRHMISFVTKTGELFDLDDILPEQIGKKIAKTTRLTMFYLKDGEMQNMIFIPLVVI